MTRSTANGSSHHRVISKWIWMGGFLDGQGTYGGVIRDEKRVMKLLAMQVGLQALAYNACMRIIVETDSPQMINMLKEQPDVDHPLLELIMNIRATFRNLSFCTATYAPRIWNMCANALAKLGYNLSVLGMIWFDVIPLFCKLPVMM